MRSDYQRSRYFDDFIGGLGKIAELRKRFSSNDLVENNAVKYVNARRIVVTL